MDDSAILSTPEMIKQIMIIRPHNRLLCMALDLAFFESYNYRTWEDSLSAEVVKWSNKEKKLLVERNSYEKRLTRVINDISELNKLLTDIANSVYMIDY